MCAANDKASLRKLVLNLRRNMSMEDVLAKSEKIFRRLVATEHYKKADTVLAYMSYGNEVSTDLLIKHSLDNGKKVAIPKVEKIEKAEGVMRPDKNNAGKGFCCLLSLYEILQPDIGIVPGYKGIPEPDPGVLEKLDPLTIDLAVVPGVVFDRRRNRIGYGAGCYDRLLPKLRPDCVKIGLAYDMQVVDKIPADKFDIPMDFIITESEVI